MIIKQPPIKEIFDKILEINNTEKNIERCREINHPDTIAYLKKLCFISRTNWRFKLVNWWRKE